MLLKSSSTPFLGSLLSSLSESPNNHSELHGNTPRYTQSSINSSQLSCNNDEYHKFRKSILGSPSPSIAASINTQNGFRRVQSEGNLEELANAKKFCKKPNFSTFDTIPSFSLHKFETCFEGDYNDEEEFDEESDEEFEVQGKSSSPFKEENFFSGEVRMSVNGYGGLEGKLYLASGIGISGGFVDGGGYGGPGGGGSYRPVAFGRDGSHNGGLGIEEHYKKMLEGNPGNPLLLRNYAQYLYQTKGDLGGAEEYYSRAILADPADGEVLSQYAKLIWELRHDRERTTNYFERAVEASSEDSHIHAAYASFLWDIEDEEEEEAGDVCYVEVPLLHHGIIASATAA